MKGYFKTMPLTTPEAKMDSDYSVEEIKDLVVHGFESSQALNLLEQFIEKNPIVQSRSTQALIERFTVNHNYLEFYNDAMLQGTTVIDYLLGVSSIDTCINIFRMLAKMWNKSESSTGQRLPGYYNSFKHIISTLSLCNAARHQSFDVIYILANQCYPFSEHGTSQKLKQEDAFNKMKQFDMSSVQTLGGIQGKIHYFDLFNKKRGNLLANIFNYLMNMNQLLKFKYSKEAEKKSTLEMLETDLFALIGDVCFDPTNSLNDIESITCNLNTNLLHVISKNICCPCISNARASSINRFGEFLQQHESHVCDHEKSEGSFSIENSHDIISYMYKHNELVGYLLGQIFCEELEEANLNLYLLQNMLQSDELVLRTFEHQRNKIISVLTFDYFDLKGMQEMFESLKYW